MGLHDEREKLRQAEQWLVTQPMYSDHFLAAYEHVTWVYRESPDQALRGEATRILRELGHEFQEG
jgi:hypothetical protein